MQREIIREGEMILFIDQGAGLELRQFVAVEKDESRVLQAKARPVGDKHFPIDINDKWSLRRLIKQILQVLKQEPAIFDYDTIGPAEMEVSRYS